MTVRRDAWPSVSVTMLVHRSPATSAAALAAVLHDGYPGSLEVLVREQGDDDEEFAALASLAEGDRRVHLERGDNLGFCEGHERLVGMATGEIVVLVNDDACLEPGYLAAVVAAFDDEAVGSVQGLLLRGGPGEASATVDTTGLVMGRSRRVRARGRGETRGAGALEPGSVWGVDGAVLALRRAALDDARSHDGRLFPTEFSAYMEDVELAWRLRRLGWQARFTPAAVATHLRGTDERDDGVARRVARRRHRDLAAHVGGFVNLRLAQVRHERPARLLRDVPWWLPRELAAWLALVVVTPGAVVPVLRGFARGLGPSVRARRGLARRVRVVDDADWFR